MPVYFFSHSPFTMAANICGVSRFMRRTIKNPELCQKLMRLAIDHILNALEYWLDTFGAEKIFVWMNSPTESNQLISPRMLDFKIGNHIPRFILTG